MSVSWYFSLCFLATWVYCGHNNPLDLLVCLKKHIFFISLSPEFSLVPDPL